jgi:hypothetical protein
MAWLDEYLDRLLNSDVFAQFPDLKAVQEMHPSLSNVGFVGNELSKNIEDRRGGFTEEDHIRSMEQDEQGRVMRVLKNSILRRPQSPADAWGPEGHVPDMFGVAKSVQGPILER